MFPTDPDERFDLLQFLTSFTWANRLGRDDSEGEVAPVTGERVRERKAREVSQSLLVAN